MLPLAAGLALLLGIGVGWFAFGRAAGLPMNDAQREAWISLQKADYDPGSIQLIGSQYGVDAWIATKGGGKHDCFILTGGEEPPGYGCIPAEGDWQMYDLQASINVKNDGRFTMVWGLLAQDTAGNPVAVMQRQEEGQQWNWRDQYSDEELPIAELLDSKGFQGDGLQIIGYDGDQPIWLHQAQQTCLIVATAEGIIGQACGDAFADQPLELVLSDVTYSMRMTDMRGPVLTVIRTPPGVTIDDKTGEIVE